MQSQQPSGGGSTHADDPVSQAEKEAAMEYPLVDLPVQAVSASPWCLWELCFVGNLIVVLAQAKGKPCFSIMQLIRYISSPWKST